MKKRNSGIKWTLREATENLGYNQRIQIYLGLYNSRAMFNITKNKLDLTFHNVTR